MTPLVEDYFGYSVMSLGLHVLGIRDVHVDDLGFDSSSVGLLGISRNVLGTTCNQGLLGSRN